MAIFLFGLSFKGLGRAFREIKCKKDSDLCNKEMAELKEYFKEDITEIKADVKEVKNTNTQILIELKGLNGHRRNE